GILAAAKRFDMVVRSADRHEWPDYAPGRLELFDTAALIVGYGRFGQTVAQMLIAQGVPVTLIDTDIEMIDVASDFGAKVYYG
ncbi:NAD-binding protein, partial [Pseudomonas sp. GP01-A4]|uniref:NAD-binding protein n=1 Tax=Pseudomonas sp. GP01-A4 TaxID=2070571 RepID=UPI001C48D7A2